MQFKKKLWVKFVVEDEAHEQYGAMKVFLLSRMMMMRKRF